jgi:hypothetical protein
LHILRAARVKIAAACFMLAGALALGAGLIAHQIGAQSQAAAALPPSAAPAKNSAKAPPLPPKADDKKVITVTGQVTDSEGKPLAGAEVTVVARFKSTNRGGDFREKPLRVLGRVKTDGKGRFHLTAPRLSSVDLRDIMILAGAAQSSLGWHLLKPDAGPTQVAIKLLPEEIIRGRLIDLQGQPAAGVKVSLTYVGKSANGMFNGVSFHRPPQEVPQWPEAAVTDADGRFTIRGVNRAQGLGLWIQDDRFAPQRLQVKENQQEVSLSLAPAQIIEGTVVYADTEKPVAHARLTVYSSDQEYGGGGGLDGRADSRGRFRLNPYSGKWFEVAAYAPDGDPYLTLQKRFAWTKGAVKSELKLALPRGVLVRGQVTEAGTGKPVAGVSVQFYPRRANSKFYREDVITGWQGMVEGGSDGAFQMPVLPGAGHLLVIGPNGDYVHQEIGSNILYSGKPGGMRYQPDALVELDLDAKRKTHEVAVTLRRGVTVTGTLLGPQGKPVAAKTLMICHTNVSALSPYWRFPVEVRDGRFELHGCDPNKSYPVFFLDAHNHWAANVTLSGKQAGKPVAVQLAMCGKATARFINPQGKAVANLHPWIEIAVTPGPYKFDQKATNKDALVSDGDYLANIDRHNYWQAAPTDKEGRITFPALIPGVTYRIIEYSGDGNPVRKEFTVESGKTRDLGDITVKRSE